MKPRVSIVIPAYNAETTIGDAIASVEAQTFHDFEVIIVDDASTDATRDVLRDRCAGREGYRVIEQASNSGPAATRNAGIAAAQGEWIAFLDGDDAWLPNRLAVQLALSRRETGVVLWCGDVAAFHAGDATDDPVPSDQELPSYRLVPLETFVNHNAVATSTVLVRKQAVHAAGGFDEAFRGPEDYDLWMRLAADHPLARIVAPLSRYRVVPGSLSMDDRTFLPQVLMVLEKAFRENGALHDYGHLRTAAISNQYWNASWMAFNRGARMRAVQLWRRAYGLNRKAPRREDRAWWRLLGRYLVGRPVTSGETGTPYP